MRIRLLALTLFLASQVSAAELAIPIPDQDHLTPETLNVVYDCSGQKLEVDYINAGPVSLAVFVRNGELVVASNVLSGSGARYAGGKYIWWTKGADGSLYDLTQGKDADPVLECSEVKNTKP